MNFLTYESSTSKIGMVRGVRTSLVVYCFHPNQCRVSGLGFITISAVPKAMI